MSVHCTAEVILLQYMLSLPLGIPAFLGTHLNLTLQESGTSLRGPKGTLQGLVLPYLYIYT